MKPMYALHKDRNGSILAAMSASYDYELSSWIRALDIRPGDKIEFGEAVKREPEIEPMPAFLEDTPTPAAPELTPELEDKDKPF